jgi:hypothetical protein
MESPAVACPEERAGRRPACALAGDVCSSCHEDLLSGRVFRHQRRYAGGRPGGCRGRPAAFDRRHRSAGDRRRAAVREDQAARHRSHQVPRRLRGPQVPPAPLAHPQNDRRGAALPERTRANATAVFEAIGRGRGRGARDAHREGPLPRSGRDRFHRRYRGRLPGLRAAGCRPRSSVLARQCRQRHGGQHEHGVLPVPAPATLRCSKASRSTRADRPSNSPPPRAPAVAVTLAERFGPMPPMRIARYRLRRRRKDFPSHANVLRVLIGELPRGPRGGTVSVIEANIDDAQPRVAGLRHGAPARAGALDASYAPLLHEEEPPRNAAAGVAGPRIGRRWPPPSSPRPRRSGCGCTRPKGACRSGGRWRSRPRTAACGSKVAGDGGFAPEYEDCRKPRARHRAPAETVSSRKPPPHISKHTQ